MRFDLYSAYYIEPQTSDTTHTYGSNVIPYGEGELDGKDPHNQWYCTEIENTTNQSRDSNPKPTMQVPWSDDTNPPASSEITPPSKPKDFQLGMDLTYRDGMGKRVAIFYKRASADSLTHPTRL